MSKKLLLVATCFVLLSVCAKVSAQGVEAFGDDAADPVRLFERGQSAHARGELEKALAYYEQALKVRPEFPEAEFQRGNALASLGRLAEADDVARVALFLASEEASFITGETIAVDGGFLRT
jgi:NAD(P)-dependent dehydrogenase (short-subunit alcohol dehydrogenase family)